jgi:hypothetical protein
MAATNVKKGDGYICGTCLDFPESWREHVLILVNRAYKQRVADQIATISGLTAPISRFFASERRPVCLADSIALLAQVMVKNLTLIRLQPNVCFCIIWKPNCARHGRRSAEMQPTGDLISGYFYLIPGLQVASRDAGTTGTTLHFVSSLRKIAPTKTEMLMNDTRRSYLLLFTEIVTLNVDDPFSVPEFDVAAGLCGPYSGHQNRPDDRWRSNFLPNHRRAYRRAHYGRE